MSASRRASTILALLVLTFCNLPFASAQEATPLGNEVTVLGPDEDYAGISRAEWDARQWQWMLSFPEDVSPALDPTGERCGYGQSGTVFFLPGTFLPDPINPTCVVPEGMAIFLGLGGVGCTTVEPPPFFGRNETELRECAEGFTDLPTEISVTINGTEVPDPMSYQNTTPAFTVAFPEDNVFGVPEGVALSVANGFSMIIAPPPPGTYEIVVSNTFEGEPEPFVGTYQVIVTAPQVIEPQASPGATPETATPAT